MACRKLSTRSRRAPPSLPHCRTKERNAQLQSWWKDAIQHWSVDNGELVNDGHGAYLTTDREYGDIELLLEYKTVPLADSGIYLRGTPQVQIWGHHRSGRQVGPQRRQRLRRTVQQCQRVPRAATARQCRRAIRPVESLSHRAGRGPNQRLAQRPARCRSCVDGELLESRPPLAGEGPDSVADARW